MASQVVEMQWELCCLLPAKWSQYNKGDVDTIRWCGQSYAPVLETREVMVLTYFPGPVAQRGSGFTMQLSVGMCVCVCVCVCVSVCVCVFYEH